MEPTLETFVEQAKNGDKAALEAVIRGIQDRVYGLALRMLWHPADAEDASQEILIKIVTHLSDFRHESAFTTWAYRIAANYLLTARKSRAEREEWTFVRYGERLDEGLSDGSLQVPAEGEQRLLVEEVKIGCTQGMLLCLDRDHRLALILGDIFEVTSEEGSDILNITPAAFRKRLSRARARMSTFMQQKCGLVNPANRCRCVRQVTAGLQNGWLEPQNPRFARHPVRARHDIALGERVQEVEALYSAAAVFRGHPDYAAPDVFVEGIKNLIDSGRFIVFGDVLEPGS